MAQAGKRRRFTAEYKAEAVKRLEESGKGLQQVADELGVHANQLCGAGAPSSWPPARPRPWSGRRPRPPSWSGFVAR
jgi:Transposase